MSAKRKRVVLTVKEKMDIVDSLNQGVSGTALAKHYGVGTSTISDIKKNKVSIMMFGSLLDSEDGSLWRKTRKSAENKELESVMFAWFTEMRNRGEPISGPIICEKALELNAVLGGDPEFKASTGWLTRFKSRHGIREIEIRGEKLPAVDRKPLAESMTEQEESGLNWKCVPSRSLASRSEVAARGYLEKTPTAKLPTPSGSTVTSSTYVPRPADTLSNDVGASNSSASAASLARCNSSISKEKVPVPVNQRPSIVGKPQVPVRPGLLVKQQGLPGLPQITEISWGAAVSILPTCNANWTADEFILPEVVHRPVEPLQPRTRDVGVQVEVITTRTKNVIHNEVCDCSSQSSQSQRDSGRLGAMSVDGCSQYDVVSDAIPSEVPKASQRAVMMDCLQCPNNKEPKKQQKSSVNSGKSERAFLVFEAMLLQLFTFCRLCFAGCSATVNSSCISVVIVRTQCSNGHTMNWSSRPPSTKSLGFVQLLQKEVNRLRNELSESQRQGTSVKKRCKTFPETIDVLKLLMLPKPITCSPANDCRYGDS